jgi:hypothetical protein
MFANYLITFYAKAARPVPAIGTGGRPETTMPVADLEEEPYAELQLARQIRLIGDLPE